MGGADELNDHPQLRPLIQYLELDDRASAIFQRSPEDEDKLKNTNLIYRNGPFIDLRLEEDFVSAALARLRASAAADDHAPLAKEDALRGWRLRAVGENFDVLVRSNTGYDDSRESTEPPGDRATSLVSQNSFRTETHALEIKSSDWTQHDVQGLSPWIKFVRSIDWSATELGDITSWSPVLREHMLSMMANPNPRVMVWGPGRTFVYNEACIPHWGEKHPHCFAIPLQDAWAETWVQIEPLFSAVYRGEVMQQRNLPLSIFRKGFTEETWFDYTLLPIHGSGGQIDGVLDELYETTATVRSHRRRDALVEFGKSISSASDLEALWSGSLHGLERAVDDVAYALLYVVVGASNRPTATANVTSDDGDSQSMQTCVLQGSVGLQTNSPLIPSKFLLHDSRTTACAITKACADACKNRVSVALNSKDNNMPEALQAEIPGRASGEAVQRAIVIPIVSISGNDILGVLITGLSPRSPFDLEYSYFINYLGDTLTRAASVLSLPREQMRAQQTCNDVSSALSEQLRTVTLQAERSEAKFARMAAAAPTGMFVYAADGRPLYANDKYLQIIGRSREEHFETFGGLSVWEELTHEDDLERFRDIYAQLMEHNIPITVEYRMKTPWTTIDKTTGQEITGERWLLANALPDVDYDGKLQSVQGWITDVSHRHFTDGLVSKKLKEALESKRLTENFIDMTSHEMRNPLSAMLQSADSIITLMNTANTLPPSKACSDHACTLKDDAAADIIDAAQTIVLCAQHQKRIVDDILTLSKMDASLLVMCPERVRLPSLLDSALRMFEAEIARVDTHTEVIIEPSYHDLNVDWVVLDSSRLLQIIINLVTNSIKFIQQSHERKITIALGASYEKPTGRHHGVCFVPPAHKETVQSPTAGWGVGEDVYIQIAVTDTGRGLSEEEMKMLFHRFSQGSPKTYKQYGGSGLGLYISRQLCEIQGGQIGASSGDGETKFTFFVRAKREQPDQRHPSCYMEPSECTVKPSKPVGKLVRPGPPVNVVDDRMINKAKTAAARLEGHRKAERYSDLQQHGSQTIPSNEDGVGQPLEVLLVEDNMINQRITSQQLRKAGGYIVHVADHGQECLDFLDRTAFCSKEIKLSIILLDLEMPVMDGWTCAREIRERQRNGQITGHVPIIAVTANARPEQIASAIEAGADAVVTKPFRIPDLVPRMREVLDGTARREQNGRDSFIPHTTKNLPTVSKFAG